MTTLSPSQITLVYTYLQFTATVLRRLADGHRTGTRHPRIIRHMAPWDNFAAFGTNRRHKDFHAKPCSTTDFPLYHDAFCKPDRYSCFNTSCCNRIPCRKWSIATPRAPSILCILNACAKSRGWSLVTSWRRVNRLRWWVIPIFASQNEILTRMSSWKGVQFPKLTGGVSQNRWRVLRWWVISFLALQNEILTRMSSWNKGGQLLELTGDVSQNRWRRCVMLLIFLSR